MREGQYTIADFEDHEDYVLFMASLRLLPKRHRERVLQFMAITDLHRGDLKVEQERVVSPLAGASEPTAG